MRMSFFLSGPRFPNVLIEFRCEEIALFPLISYSRTRDGPKHNGKRLTCWQTDLVLTDNMGTQYNLVSRRCLEWCCQNSV